MSDRVSMANEIRVRIRQMGGQSLDVLKIYVLERESPVEFLEVVEEADYSSKGYGQIHSATLKKAEYQESREGNTA